jgi:hypothetical protein
VKKHVSLWVALVAFGMGACERHEWEETKQLYEDHGEHGEGAGHGKEAGKEKHD